jgi:Fe-S cluster assembly protein SufD
MSAETALQRIAASHAGQAAQMTGGAAWARRRELALARVLGRGLPDRRDENWKYLDHAKIAERAFDPAPRVTLTADRLAPCLLPLAAARRLVLVDGHFEPLLSDADAGVGVMVDDLETLLSTDPAHALRVLREPGDDADDRYALLADAFAAGGVVIRVDASAAPAEPLYLLHVSSGSLPGASHTRVVIEVGAGAKLRLVEHFVALGDAPAFSNLAAELRIAEGATVEHLRLHQSGPQSAQLETWVVEQQMDSSYSQHLFALGGRLLRSNLNLSLIGSRAQCRLAGLFMVDGERQADLYTQIAHHGVATRTHQNFRGIASERGRGAFNGRIVVHPAARGADASQSSRNLLLTPLAEINSRPQLEIHTDDVKCRHGATIGTLDPAQLFYLLARGIDPAVAQSLLTFAFCEDVVAGVPLPELRRTIEELVVGRLPDRDVIRSFR